MSYSASGDAPERPGKTETAPAEGQAAGPPTAATAEGRPEIPRTRTARAHNALIAGAIVLILLLVFILENTQSVKISYFGASFNMPLGVALLLAAIGGALLVGIVGTARIMQLRRRVRHRD
ncbi:MAG TPA: lipopolysaccharide assembly protein LapA domain-containing protein [Solirubrobacteraceae bacterium]|nr:lipopolysaccharide assembly protein LapA domain-containing protein [Solirubrobacteraceae bacterium]